MFLIVKKLVIGLLRTLVQSYSSFVLFTMKKKFTKSLQLHFHPSVSNYLLCRFTLITEVSEVMKPMYRNGLKGHQHIAQGIALGRRTIVKFALKGHKPYHASLCFCPCRAPLLRFALTQDALALR